MAVEQKESEREVDVSDRGLFGFGKKDEKEEKINQEEVLVTGVDYLHVEEKKEEGDKTKESLFEKLHRSNSSSSGSSSDEEEGLEGEKKKKKKKGLKDKLKEKLSGDTKESAEEETMKVITPAAVAETEDTAVVVEKIEESSIVKVDAEEEKKPTAGFLEKIKEKLPGNHKNKESNSTTHEEESVVVVKENEEGVNEEEQVKEKKGILGKIMDKLPGYHKDETAASH